MSKNFKKYYVKDNENARLQKFINNFYKCSENCFYIWNSPETFSLDSVFYRELNFPNSDIKIKIISRTFEETEKNIKDFVKSMKKYIEIKYITIKKINPDNMGIYGYFEVQNNELKLIDISDGTERKITRKKFITLILKKGQTGIYKMIKK